MAKDPETNEIWCQDCDRLVTIETDCMCNEIVLLRRLVVESQANGEARGEARLQDELEKANDAYLGIKADYASARQAWHRNAQNQNKEIELLQVAQAENSERAMRWQAKFHEAERTIERLRRIIDTLGGPPTTGTIRFSDILLAKEGEIERLRAEKSQLYSIIEEHDLEGRVRELEQDDD